MCLSVSLSVVFPGFAHAVAEGRLASLLRLNSILLHVYTVFFYICIPHIFLH